MNYDDFLLLPIEIFYNDSLALLLDLFYFSLDAPKRNLFTIFRLILNSMLQKIEIFITDRVRNLCAS